MIRTVFPAVWLIIIAAICAACNSSPTVPIPPPTLTQIIVTEPDTTGFVHVIGEPDTVQWNDIVLLFNEHTGDGAMKEAETDGSFEISISAQRGHVLILQIKRDNRFSPETELVVE